VYGKPSLVLLHSPEKNFEIAWKQLTSSTLECKYGVSNFTQENIERLEGIPYANQIELSPYCQSRKTVSYCKEKGIRIQGHSTLAKGELLDESVLYKLAKKHTATVAQVMLAWGIKKNYTMCFTTKNIDHLREDLESVDIADKLTVDDMELLDSLDCGYRTHPQFLVV
jgi:2,5-diketo-D-gluconate reductase B